MKKLLEYDGDVESFGLTFHVQHEYLGEIFNYELLVAFFQVLVVSNTLVFSPMAQTNL